MSASLVGSEMCIRDRPPSPDPGPPSDWHFRCAGRPVGRPGRVAARQRGAVSYTHLTLPTICSV
eukprot:11241388-Alexandrium_andersonii.AAC.1